MRVRVGIVGCGSFGRNAHAANYKRLADEREVELVCVCDVRAEAAELTGREYGVPHYTDHRAMLGAHELDLVSVVTLCHTRRDITLDCLAAGADVLCAKPMAMNAAQAQEMIESAKRHGRLLTVGFPRRFNADSEALKAAIDDGLLGTVYFSRCWSNETVVPTNTGHHVKERSGGGTLHSSGVHSLDLAIWMLGNPKPLWVTGAWHQRPLHMRKPLVADQRSLGEFDTEDHAVGHVLFEDGRSLVLESNWLVPRERASNALEIWGDDGWGRLDPLTIHVQSGEEVIVRTPSSLAPTVYIYEELRHMVRCVRERAVPRVRFGELLTVQRIMDAIYASCERREPVRVG